MVLRILFESNHIERERHNSMRARRFFSLSLSLKQHTRSLLILKEEEEEEEEETLLKTCLYSFGYNWGIGRAKKARTTRRVMTSMSSFPTRERNGASSSSPNTNATTLTPSPVVPQSEKEKEKEKHFGRGLMMTEEDPTLKPTSRAEHFILAWISIRPSVTRLVQFGLDPFREEIRFVLEGVLWKEISSSDYDDGKKNSSSSNNTTTNNTNHRRRKRRLLWTKGISVRVVIVFLILYPNYIAFAACAAFIRASLRARRRATRRRETSEKEEELAIPRMSTYSVVVLETIADRLETIASIASGRDPLALRVACFGCAWLFVLSFFVSFNAWFATFVLFATKPKGATKVLEALFR